MSCGPRMNEFRNFLDAIDTSGGHIFICLVAGSLGTLLGIVCTYLAWPDTAMVATFATVTGGMTGFFQIAAYAMQGKGKANGKDDYKPLPPAEPKP